MIARAKCGIRVDDGDVNGFALACEAFLNSSTERLAMGRAALGFFQQNCDAAKVIPRLAGLVTFQT